MGRQHPAVPEPGQVPGQVGVLLAGGVQQHVEPRQPGRERARVGAGVVHAVGQQQHPRVAGRHPGQLARRDLKREGDVGQALGRDAQHRVEQLLRREALA
jgi:hypothetical protein